MNIVAHRPVHSLRSNPVTQVPVRRSRRALALAVISAPLLAVSSPEESVKAFSTDPGKVHPELDISLYASEPLSANPTSIDIDARGRVWMIEGFNYRKHSGLRPEGDRILILEDKDGDGKADSDPKVFFQDKRINAALGICVLGNKVIVSSSPEVLVLHDSDGDDKCDKVEVLFSGVGQAQHDHSVHAMHFGPDGRYYFNFGNTGKALLTGDGKPVVDADGKVISDVGKPYRQGMAFRCNPDGSNIEVLGHNFRNNFELCVDAFLNVWQSDNDDDGNKAVRLNYVMEHGNYGYVDELNGAGWQKGRSNLEATIPQRHWHLNDPGVVPTLIITGAGSPTGICIYEGTHLPAVFQGQVFHCDAGPSLLHAIISTPQGAGFAAKDVTMVQSSDKWFRPSDVCVHPDGSLIVADWCDPGVGGHAMGDNKLGEMKGRLYRITTKGQKPVMPKLDLATVDGAAAALASPNESTRHLAWQKLRSAGASAEPALTALWKGTDQRLRARALHLLTRIDGQAQKWVDAALADDNSDLRITALRIAEQHKLAVAALVAKVVKDAVPAVRRQAAIALYRSKSPDAPKLWAELAAQHDGKDRWYLEALGIGAIGNEDATLAAWLAKVGAQWDTPAGHDVIWRSRGKDAPAHLAKIIAKVPAAERPRFFRAFDFLVGPEKEAALTALAADAALSPEEKAKEVAPRQGKGGQAPPPSVNKMEAPTSDAGNKPASAPFPPLDQLLAMPANAAKGQLMFMSRCGMCHLVNGRGFDFGPDLSEIGSKLGKDGLIDSILNPSNGISHGFEGTEVVLTNGRKLLGIIISDADDGITLKIKEGRPKDIAKTDIAKATKLDKSLMPQDITKGMTAQQLVDVVAYLFSLKAPPKP